MYLACFWGPVIEPGEYHYDDLDGDMLSWPIHRMAVERLWDEHRFRKKERLCIPYECTDIRSWKESWQWMVSYNGTSQVRFDF